MIEVEKKFRPTEEQLQALLKDSQFMKEVVNDDIVYDYPDYRLISNSIRFRRRSGKFELKIGRGLDGYSAEEIENEEDIKKYFNISSSLEDFIKDNLIEGMHIVTKRKKYKKDDFSIDIDELDFGYKCVEIELMVSSESEADEAHRRILQLAKEYNFDTSPVPAKKKEYFRKVKPEVFKQLYPNG